MIIDNADDKKISSGEDEDQAARSSSPNAPARHFTRLFNGWVLLTARNKMPGVKFAAVNNVIIIPKMCVLELKACSRTYDWKF